MGAFCRNATASLSWIYAAGVVGLIATFRRGRRSDQGGIDDGSFAHHQAFVRELGVDRIEDLVGQLMTFKQPAELEQCREIRGGLARAFDADEAADRQAIVDRVFAPFVRQPEALLRRDHPQNSSEPDRRATGLFSLRIVRFESGRRRRPRRYRLDLGQKPVSSREILLLSVLKVGKACLHAQSRRRWPDRISLNASVPWGHDVRLNQRLLQR